MKLPIVFSSLGILLALFIWKANTCDEESKQRTASAMYAIPDISITADEIIHYLLSEDMDTNGASHSDTPDCCEGGCSCKMTNCHHIFSLTNLLPYYLNSKFAERYKFTVLSVPSTIAAPPYRPPIAFL